MPHMAIAHCVSNLRVKQSIESEAYVHSHLKSLNSSAGPCWCLGVCLMQFYATGQHSTQIHFVVTHAARNVTNKIPIQGIHDDSVTNGTVKWMDVAGKSSKFPLQVYIELICSANYLSLPTTAISGDDNL